MMKLKRTIDGEVFDCEIVVEQSPSNANNLHVVFYEDGKWKDYPLIHFVPAKPGVDY